MNNFLSSLKKHTKLLLTLGMLLIVYGYICRLLNLYIFWESRFIGWDVLFVGIIALLYSRIKQQKKEGKKVLLERIGVGVITFVLLIQTILFIVLPRIDAFASAERYIMNSKELSTELGEIKGVFAVPLGSIESSQGSGSAELNLIVKGQKKFKDIAVYLEKNADSTDWKIMGIQ
jgi:energy-coupling factor transporter transmembrane protein EcfT